MTVSYASGVTLYLATKLTPSGTMIVTTDPGPSNGRLYLVNDQQTEWIDFTSVTPSGSYYVLGGLTRDLSPTTIPTTSLSTGKTWLATQKCILVDMHDQKIDMNKDTNFLGTSKAGLVLKSLTTAQRTALTPTNGSFVYDSTLGENYQYIAGAWSAVSAGSTQPNASTTVAGKVEIATSAQSISATDTGETGALLSILPSDTAKNIQSGTFVYGTDVGGDDTYVVALTPVLTAYTIGQRLTFIPTTANTGACSVDFGPSVLNIKTKDGNDPQTGVLRALKPVTGTYDGTNFVLDSEDFATTANKGIVEMATDAEATTGIDETRYVNPKQAKDNYGVIPRAVSATRDLSVASGAVTYAHGLGIIPKFIRITGFGPSGLANGSSLNHTIGTYDGTTNRVIGWTRENSTGQTQPINSSGTCIFLGEVGATGAYQTAVATFDATNVTLTWTKNGSPTGNCNILIESFA